MATELCLYRSDKYSMPVVLNFVEGTEPFVTGKLKYDVFKT